MGSIGGPGTAAERARGWFAGSAAAMGGNVHRCYGAAVAATAALGRCGRQLEMSLTDVAELLPDSTRLVLGVWRSVGTMATAVDAARSVHMCEVPRGEQVGASGCAASGSGSGVAGAVRWWGTVRDGDGGELVPPERPPAEPLAVATDLQAVGEDWYRQLMAMALSRVFFVARSLHGSDDGQEEARGSGSAVSSRLGYARFAVPDGEDEVRVEMAAASSNWLGELTMVAEAVDEVSPSDVAAGLLLVTGETVATVPLGWLAALAEAWRLDTALGKPAGSPGGGRSASARRVAALICRPAAPVVVMWRDASIAATVLEKTPAWDDQTVQTIIGRVGAACVIESIPPDREETREERRVEGTPSVELVDVWDGAPAPKGARLKVLLEAHLDSFKACVELYTPGGAAAKGGRLGLGPAGQSWTTTGDRRATLGGEKSLGLGDRLANAILVAKGLAERLAAEGARVELVPHEPAAWEPRGRACGAWLRGVLDPGYVVLSCCPAGATVAGIVVKVGRNDVRVVCTCAGCCWKRVLEVRTFALEEWPRHTHVGGGSACPCDLVRGFMHVAVPVVESGSVTWRPLWRWARTEQLACADRAQDIPFEWDELWGARTLPAAVSHDSSAPPPGWVGLLWPGDGSAMSDGEDAA